MAALFYPGSKMLLVDNRINRCTCMVSDFTFTYFNYYIFISYPCLLFIYFYIVSFLFVYLKNIFYLCTLSIFIAFLKKFHDFETFRNFFLIIIYCSKRIFLVIYRILPQFTDIIILFILRTYEKVS